ncbi:hypothetical protein N7495_007600 [Penicillium taxi]|uniref:uncharacterized protein n=1 Tax=Penicillium taxi TaxID=168475 RepID=UPI002545B333|nr:uncharacterized protein N7495_007600 [Penicillium taxi]KAJ5887559.1 hypothetical protein N7495_007600 [Penicillium taxi]
MADNPQRHPNLNLTPEEKHVFYQLFQVADTTNLGVITGETAVPFFEKTHLPSGTLGEIWQLADKENRGLLTPSGFGIVLRLIGHAQAGRIPSEELALQAGPLPRFEGVSVDLNVPIPDSRAISPPPTASSSSIRVPPLQHEDAVKFVSLFDKSDIVNGMISGEAAKQIFERARLPNEVLGRIWNLSDTKQRGALDATEFVIAMHLLTSFKSGALRGIPQTLPPGLYEAASRRGPALVPAAPARPSYARPEVPPVPSIPKQFTGPQRTASPMSPVGRTFAGQLSAQTTGAEWLISPQEKAHFDTIFETVDTAKVGVITGDQAVTFFIKAQLPEEVLAQIWDLADIDADGQLTREEFAVAMYLVRLQRGGKEPLPQVLPPALIPPNMRRQAPVPAAPVAAPAPPPAPLPRSAADDLFGLDSPSPPPAQTQFPQSTGGSNPAFHIPASPTSRSSPLAASTTFKPFIPTSSFGQTLHPQMTGASSGTPVSIRSPAPPADDLLGDSDPVESSKLTQETTELANLSNQIGSLATEMHNVQEKRTTAEHDISQTSQQKRDFEARLAQARAMYEQEVANYKALEERLKTSKAETVKLQQEYALIEGSRQDLQTQYTQISTALASDQQENASLKEKIRYANAEVAKLKPALEKARSDARQHKGLVAINKKQLATVESERDKVQGEIDSLSQEAQQHVEESARAISPSADVASPAASNASQNTNPFFRRAATSPSERAVSPDAPTDQQKTFDSLFGQSFMAPALSGAPPTSFHAESPQTFAKSPIPSNVPSPSVSPAPVSLPGSFPSGDPPTPIPSHLIPGFSFNENQSVTSSTVVSPPASRFGGPEGTASDFGPPSATGSSEYSHVPTSAVDGTVARSPFDEFSPEVTSTAEVAAFETPDSALSPTATGNEEASKDLSFDELFGSKAHKRSESENANDFEEAFASLKPQHSGFASDDAPQAATSEFPPIQELHPEDEDEESSDDESVRGFDDNFEPVVSKKEKQADTIDASQLAAFPTPGSSLPQPPSADAQQSPPTYEDGSGDSTLPAEFNGLLPERADPTLAPDAPHSVEASTGAPIVGGLPQHDEAFTTDSAAAFGEVKTGGTDFDAAFAGLDLAPAKEAEDEEDEVEDDKGTADFDFSFDVSQSNHAAASATDANKGGSSEFFDFDSNVPTAAAELASAPNGDAANHDWDALFAPLDNSKPASEGNTNGSDPKSPGWALNTDTGEDDLILQRLTGMGYPRDEALAALEKFDYNLEKAADYLTSK